MSRPRVSRRLCSITASASMVLAGLTVGVSARSAGDADEDVAATRALGLLAAARPVRVPGNFEGVGFDVCSAPDQATMDALRTESPYWGVGVYIGGANRTCDQPELTAAWIHTQHARGWHIFPIFIGLQAPVLHRGTSREVWCIDGSRHRKPMRANNEMAREQGRLAAIRAVGRA
ncbi:MAG TPA: glycoside hydrolase domain-containing protein, partial [Nocardioidaceae bacterium]